MRYAYESGALNEHIADAFGIMVKQWTENTVAADSDWLIGERCLMPKVKGVALRNMKEPGTAYDDIKVLGVSRHLCRSVDQNPWANLLPQGKDPQPSHNSRYIRSDNTPKGDYGGVHKNSGIPNRAFALAAIEMGGYSWQKIGQIWWKTVTTKGKLPRECTFTQFADATVEFALDLYDECTARIVRKAWDTVGVVCQV